MSGAVDERLTRLMELWTEPVPDGPAGAETFATAYADPVVVNGVPMTPADLAERARALQGALADRSTEILDTVVAGDQVAVAFVIRARQVGPYPSPVGTVEASGREVAVRTIDVLTFTDGLISRIWVNTDELGLLTQVGAVGRAGPAGQAP